MPTPTKLPVLAGLPSLQRHPDDAWLASPRRFGRSTEQAVRALIRALLPPPPAPRPPDIEQRMLEHLGMMMQYMPAPMALGMQLLAHILDLSPLWRLRGTRRLRSLSPEQASAALDAITQHRWLPVRMLTLPPKAIILSGYFDQDEVHEAIDYAPLPFMHERLAQRAARMSEQNTAPRTEVAP